MVGWANDGKQAHWEVKICALRLAIWLFAISKFYTNLHDADAQINDVVRYCDAVNFTLQTFRGSDRATSGKYELGFFAQCANFAASVHEEEPM